MNIVIQFKLTLIRILFNFVELFLCNFQNGFTPGYYQINSGVLNYSTLLEEFDAPTYIARDMLTGQGKVDCYFTTELFTRSVIIELYIVRNV